MLDAELLYTPFIYHFECFFSAAAENSAQRQYEHEVSVSENRYELYVL